MKKLILTAAFALPLAITMTAGSPTFAQDAGPARPDQGYLPPGSWLPGSTGVAYSVWGAAYVKADGCTYQDRYEKGINDAEPHIAETVLVGPCPPPPPPPPVVDNPPTPATGTNTATNDPPPPPPPPPENKPPEPMKPVTGFVDPPPPPPPPPPVEPSRWERFKHWCKSFLECEDEATERKEHEEALRKAVEERRAEMRKEKENEKRAEHPRTIEKNQPRELKQESKPDNSKTRELKQESKFNKGKSLNNLHTQNRFERAGLAHPAKSNLHSMNAMSRGHSFGNGMGGMHGFGGMGGFGGMHGGGGMHGFGGMRGGRMSMR